jgi:predicted enzyme related to lactoylglutathione lyase
MMLSLLALLALPSQVPVIEVHGLELPVRDVAAAARLYREAFDFETRYFGGEVARLEKDGVTLLLVAGSSPEGATPGSAVVSLNLQTADLTVATELARTAGFLCEEPRSIAIGRACSLRDPDGNEVHLLELDRGTDAPATGCRVFNLGLNLERDGDLGFLLPLGFEVFSEDYLPDTLPLVRRGAAELVVHGTAARPSGGGARLLLRTERLEPWRESLADLGLVPAGSLARAAFGGRRVLLEAPSGVRVSLLERSPDQLAFERLFELAGSWEGQSTQGWTARITIEPIARGSALLERSNFEAHPGETMLSLFHMDRGRLVLQHTCVAGNQPLLEVSEIEPERLAFSFRSGLDLATRDHGHMDAAEFRFTGPDAFSSRWSYYQDGRTSWMEEIRYTRTEPDVR